MFGPLIRGGLTLIAGSFLYVILQMAGGDLLGVQRDVAPGSSTNPYWADVVLTWFPAIVLAMVAAILIGGAVARRGSL